MRIQNSPVIGIWGRRGSGKSTFAAKLVAGAPRLVVFDPMHQWDIEAKCSVSKTLQSVRDQLATHYKGSFRVAYQVDDQHELRLSKLCKFLWDFQAVVGDRKAPEIVLAVDELQLAAPPHSLPSGQEWFKKLVLTGRHRNIAIVGVAQRPTTVSPHFRAQLISEVVFIQSASVEYNDLKQRHGLEVAKRAKELQKFEHLLIGDELPTWNSQVKKTPSKPRRSTPRANR